MQRRQVLAAVAALPLAGCLGPGNGADQTTETTNGDGQRFEGAELTVENAACATEDAEEATVSFDDEVTISGTIIGADACYVAVLDADEFNEATDTLTVVVKSERQADEDTACAQCITGIDYRVVARFSGELPDRVVVKHRRDGGTRTIADVERA